MLGQVTKMQHNYANVFVVFMLLRCKILIKALPSALTTHKAGQCEWDYIQTIQTKSDGLLNFSNVHTSDSDTLVLTEIISSDKFTNISAIPNPLTKCPKVLEYSFVHFSITTPTTTQLLEFHQLMKN